MRAALLAGVLVLTGCTVLPMRPDGEAVITPSETTIPSGTLPPTALPFADASIKCSPHRDTILLAGWPEELLQWVYDICWRESRGVWDARNSCCHGLMQIHESWLPALRSAGIAWTIQDLYDPLTNLRAAWYIWSTQGRCAWSTARGC